MSWSQDFNPLTPGQKGNHPQKQLQTQNDNTTVKNETRIVIDRFDNFKTPVPINQPKKALVFLGNNKSKHLFPLYRDQQIGIRGQAQRKVHPSMHDDDKMTTTTQLGMAISQTCQDLYEVLNCQYKSQHISYTSIQEWNSSSNSRKS